jgi:hypothetical protein
MMGTDERLDRLEKAVIQLQREVIEMQRHLIRQQQEMNNHAMAAAFSAGGQNG